MSHNDAHQPIWYVLQVPPHAEFRIANELKRLRLHYMVPHTKANTRKIVGGVKLAPVLRKIPLFPKYVFVGVAGEPRWADIKALEPSPVRPVIFDNESGPARLTSAEVAYLATAQDIPTLNKETLREGVLAKIANGPLAGLYSTVHKLRGEYAELDSKLGKMRVKTADLVAA